MIIIQVIQPYNHYDTSDSSYNITDPAIAWKKSNFILIREIRLLYGR